LLGKTPLTKKAHKKSLISIEQSLVTGPNCQAGRGKDGTAVNLGQAWLLQKGEVKEASTWAAVSGRGGAALEHRNLSLGVFQMRSEGKMAADLEMMTLLFYQL
jgi:hypothetical protein